MENHNNHWHERENRRLCTLVKACLDNGDDPDYEKIGKELGRTARACSDQWKKLYKSKRQTAPKAVNWEKEINDRLEQDIRLRNRWVELDEIIRAATEEREKIKQVLHIGEAE